VAKQTLLAAYDAVAVNGTICFADQSLVGGATNQGLWFMDVTDPNYGATGYPSAANAVGRNGWRKYKPVRWVGMSSGPISGAHTPALILPGKGGLWGRTTSNTPAIWIAGGNSGMEFWNMAISGAACCLRAGFSTTMGDASTASLHIENCDFRCPQEKSGDDGVSGPVIDLGYAFWVDIENTDLRGYCTTGIDPSSDRRAVILCRQSSVNGPSPWLVNVNRAMWSAGGMKYHPGRGTTTVTLSHIVEEGISTNAPLFWLVGNASCYIRATDVIMADAPVIAGMATIQIDASILNGNVVVDTPSVNGPATIIGDYASLPMINSPHMKGQIGFAKGALWGTTHALRYNFPPVTVLWSNICGTTLPSNCSWTNDPIGGTNAITGIAANTALQSFEICHLASPIAVGDWLVWGAWIRVPGGSPQNGTEGEFYVNIGKGNAFGRSEQTYSGSTLHWLHDGWQWVSGYDLVTKASSSPTAITAHIYYYTNQPLWVWNQTVLYIPASAGVSSNDVAEIATHMAGWPSGVIPGAVTLQPGQKLALFDTATQTWSYFSVSNSQPIITDGAGDVLYWPPNANAATATNSTHHRAQTLVLQGGTNAVMDLSTNYSGTYMLTLTTNVFFSFTNYSSAWAGQWAEVIVLNQGTNQWAFDTNMFKFQGGNILTCATNATKNAWSRFTFKFGPCGTNALTDIAVGYQ
jgi:hypothetical protein